MNSNLDLLSRYLDNCLNITNNILKLDSKVTSLSTEALSLIQDINHTANVLSAIYFYRQETDLEVVLSQLPLERRNLISKPFSIIWKYLERLTPDEITDVAVEAIQTNSHITDKLIRLNIINK